MSRATSKFGDYSIHNEWQQTKAEFRFKAVKKDRKIVAVLRDIKGKQIIAIPKRAEEFVLSKGRVTIPKSMTAVLMCLGRPDLQIEVSNGDTYFCSYADFEAHRYTEGETSVHYWYMDADKFEFTKGEAESIAKAMMVGKWK